VISNKDNIYNVWYLDDELERQEAVVAYFKALFWNVLGGTEDPHKIFQS
jgi:hypothetical protein